MIQWQMLWYIRNSCKYSKRITRKKEKVYASLVRKAKKRKNLRPFTRWLKTKYEVYDFRMTGNRRALSLKILNDAENPRAAPAVAALLNDEQSRRLDGEVEMIEMMLKFGCKQGTPGILLRMSYSERKVSRKFMNLMDRALYELRSPEYAALYADHATGYLEGGYHTIARILKDLRDPRCVKPLMRWNEARRPQWPWADAMAYIGIPEMLPELFAGIEKCKAGDNLENHLRSSWCGYVLVHMKNEELIEPLTQYLQSNNNQVYLTAIKSLTQYTDNPQAKQVIMDELEANLEDNWRKSIALTSLSFFKGEDIRELLLHHQTDKKLSSEAKENIEKALERFAEESAADARG